MKVQSLINSNGNAVANQFVITDGTDINFQSYDSMVVSIRKGGLGFDRVVVFGRDWDYSRTTMRHVANFLRTYGLDVLASAKDIREALERGHARYDESIAVLYDETL